MMNILNMFFLLPFFNQVLNVLENDVQSVIPRYGKTLITVLIIILVILLCIIIYLYLKGRFSDKSKKKEQIVVETGESEIHPKVSIKQPMKQRTILNYSIQASMHLATDETLATYETLMNHMMQYEGVSSNQTWKYIRYMYRKKSIAKIKMQGKTIKLFLALTVDEVNDEKYHLEDVSKVKTHEKTPVLLTVKGPRSVTYAKVLIDMIMEKYQCSKNNTYVKQNINIKSMTKLQLLKKGLIKTNDATFIERLEEEEKKNKQ